MLSLNELPPSGSDRRYYRVKGKQHSALAVYNQWSKENQTFVDYSRHFKAKGLSVPEIYHFDALHNIYLLEDLGDQTLLMRLEAERNGPLIPDSVLHLYKNALRDLAFMQIKGKEQLDLSLIHI